MPEIKSVVNWGKSLHFAPGHTVHQQKTHSWYFQDWASNIRSLPFVNTAFKQGPSSRLNAPEVS